MCLKWLHRVSAIFKQRTSTVYEKNVPQYLEKEISWQKGAMASWQRGSIVSWPRGSAVLTKRLCDKCALTEVPSQSVHDKEVLHCPDRKVLLCWQRLCDQCVLTKNFYVRMVLLCLNKEFYSEETHCVLTKRFCYVLTKRSYCTLAKRF